MEMRGNLTIQASAEDVSIISANQNATAAITAALKKDLCNAIPIGSNCDITVTKVGVGVDGRRKRVFRRSLQANNALVVEFLTSIQVLCGTSTCSDAETLGTALYNTATGALKAAMQDGSFISDLQAELSKSQITATLDGASAAVSLDELIIPILQRYPSSSPSSMPSCTPSASPTGSPSSEYGVKMFYPNWLIGDQGCR